MFKRDGDETGKVQRIIAAHALPSVGLLVTEAEPEADLSPLHALYVQYDGRASLSPEELSEFLPVFADIGLDRLSVDCIAPLRPLLPPLPLDSQLETFQLLSFLFGRADFAKQIFDWGFVQDLEYGDFASLPDPAFQDAIISSILSLMSHVPESLEVLSEVFYPPFIDFIGQSIGWIFQHDRLDDVIWMIDTFIPLRVDTEVLGSLLELICVRFIHHPDARINRPAIDTTTRLISVHPDVLASEWFERASFYQRLEYLAGQQDQELAAAVATLWTHVLVARDASASFEALAGLLGSELWGISRGPMLALLAVAITLPDFVAGLGDHLGEWLAGLCDAYPAFKVKEKLEMGFVIANVLYNFDIEFVNELFASERFLQSLLDTLELDDEDVTLSALRGMHRAVTHPRGALLGMAEQRERLAEAIQEVAGNSDELARTAEILVRVLRA
jgi:hypothetical protein